ncbi:MAG: putative secreted protein [Herbinix sp.]|jgi:spermidine/putrescine-binding protein|nr:putative secreted protein [Herbinix sp.]
MKKILLCVSLLAVSFGFMTGCSKDEGEKVYVYNWGEYIDPEVIDLFEEETGIKVVYDEFEQNEEMYPKIKAGAVQYDVVCPSDYMIQKMIEEDLLAEINFDNVPNITNIDPTYLNSAKTFDPENKYSVPYCWGTLGILYNKTMVDGPIDSWSAIFDERYSGDILMIDSVRDAFGIALSYLGYDLNSTDESQLEQAKQLLSKQYPLVQAYVVDQVRDKMIGGEAALGVIYSGEAIFTQRENPDLEYVVPNEGSNVWIDGWVIPKNCRDKENAEAFINYMCSAEIALKNFDYITYSTPNSAARELITDEDIKNSRVAFPEQSVLDRCRTYRYLGEEMEAEYIDRWNEVKSN